MELERKIQKEEEDIKRQKAITLALEIERLNRKRDVEEYLNTLGLQERECKGNGACAVNAISYAINGTEEHHGYYRDVIVNEMRKNPRAYIPFIDCDRTKESYEQYLNRIAQPLAWLDNVHLQAAATALRVNFNVFRDTDIRGVVRKISFVGAVEGVTKEFYLIYVDNNHFNVIKRKPPSPVIAPVCAHVSVEVPATGNKVIGKLSKCFPIFFRDTLTFYPPSLLNRNLSRVSSLPPLTTYNHHHNNNNNNNNNNKLLTLTSKQRTRAKNNCLLLAPQSRLQVGWTLIHLLIQVVFYSLSNFINLSNFPPPFPTLHYLLSTILYRYPALTLPFLSSLLFFR